MYKNVVDNDQSVLKALTPNTADVNIYIPVVKNAYSIPLIALPEHLTDAKIHEQPAAEAIYLIHGTMCLQYALLK